MAKHFIDEGKYELVRSMTTRVLRDVGDYYTIFLRRDVGRYKDELMD